MVCAAAGPPPWPGLPSALRMSCSWIQQSSTRMCKKSLMVPGPVGVGISLGEVIVVRGRAALRSRSSTSVVPLGEHLGAGEPAAGLDLCSLNWPIGFFTCSPMTAGGSARRQALQHPLRADQVRQVVLHRPTGEVGRQLPLVLVELSAEVGDGLPDRLELVDGVGAGSSASSGRWLLDGLPTDGGEVRLERVGDHSQVAAGLRRLHLEQPGDLARRRR